MSRRVVILLLSATTAACVAPPERRNPETLVTPPEQWSAAEQPTGAVLSDWWRTFNDPSLNSLIEIALERNQILQAAVARVDRAAAEARIAGADLKPTLGLGLNAGRQRQNFIGFPIPGGGDVLSTTATRYGLSLETTWEADLWGRIRAGARASVAELQATEADLRGARLSLAGQTAKIWFAVSEAQKQVELSRGSAESFRRLADQIRARYQRGIRPALDLRLALSNQELAEASLSGRRLQLDATLRQLEVLLADYPAASIADRFPAVDVVPPPPVPAGLPADLVARRPDLVAAERRLAAADQRLVAARKALYPRLSLTASGGTVSEQLTDLLKGDFRVWSIVGNLTQPLFQGGRLRAGIDRAGAVTEEVLAFYAQAVLQAYAEVETTLAAERYLSERELHLSNAVEQLVAAERVAEERYRSGVGDYLPVLEAQTRAFLTKADLLSLQRARLDNRVDLHLALGGGFEATPTPVEPKEPSL